MKNIRARLLLMALLGALLSASGMAAEISGELKKWHNVTLTFEGPQTSEQADPNPFMDYRLNVTFTHPESGERLVVPGYYAADGDAANTSADSGSKWRAHLAPSQTGEWEYSASFRTGPNVAVSAEGDAGESGGSMDGATGSFEVGPTDKTGRDMRAKGLLQYVGEHYLRFAETDEYFLKAGADAPENFLAYADFDGDFKDDGHNDQFIKTWEPHIRDWEEGDPTWQDGKGKGMIGAINYLASKGMNVFSFLPMNIEGDDRNVFPYTDYDERERLDVSRLAQWEIVFEHATRKGMYLHFKTQETENELLLDNGDMGPHRTLYYRELIARFAHHLALNWNLGEEVNDATTEQKKAWAQYFWDNDPYQHHIVIHNMGEPHYDLLGPDSALTGFSLQTSRPDFSQVHQRVLNYVERSAEAGKPWVVACDEPGDASHGLIPDHEDPTRDNPRMNALWGAFMAGGAGIEWYFGYQHDHSDLTCEDWRSREKMWEQCRYLLDFFKQQQIPFWDGMESMDDLTPNGDDYVFAKPNERYLVYLKSGNAEFELPEGDYVYGWFNPRTGEGADELLAAGRIEGPCRAVFTKPGRKDWLLSVTELSHADAANLGGALELSALADFDDIDVDGFVPAYRDEQRDALAIDPAQHKDEFAAARTEFEGPAGTYRVTLETIAENDGESTYRLVVNGEQVGAFQNPEVDSTYESAETAWEDVVIGPGDTIQVEFNTATNEADGWSRGRWTKLRFEAMQ
ncbi:MAG: DUF5060 domain-containing protein [Candidatus Hydrogenedentota bacterium]